MDEDDPVRDYSREGRQPALGSESITDRRRIKTALDHQITMAA